MHAGSSISKLVPIPMSDTAMKGQIYNQIVESGDKSNLEKQQERMDQLRARVNAAKIAYLNGTPFGDKEKISYEDLKEIAQEFIRETYDFQKKKYGAVKVKISVAKLLRR
jgi:hypothetical protein